MPRKIAFTVISWSGHEENYSAKELMIHAPTVSGWRSSRFCPYPQEITLQMVERCRIRKLQLLAHQYLISAKIEFHIGDRLLEPVSSQYPQQLCRLGYVSLSNNEKTGFRARELKSVHVDAVGTFLKLTFHRNYTNQYNIYNQVALVAINILGDPVECSDHSPVPSRDHLIEQYLRRPQQSSALDTSYGGCKNESISPLDDLAFDMYQDPEIARIIRLLDDKKQDMVRLERYDLAKKLKQAIADLQKVGERLGRYDVEKQSAIEREDYDTAKQKKEQMESYRLRVYQELALHDLLNIEQIHRVAESMSDFGVASPAVKPFKHTPHSPTSPEKREQEQLLDEEEKIVSKDTDAKTPQTPPHLPKSDINSLLYDEKPLPAMKMRNSEHPQPQPEQSPSLLDQNAPNTNALTGQPEPLKEKVQREASLPIEVYGDSLVAEAYSKTWSYRENALLTVYKKLTEIPSGTPKVELRNVTRAAVFLCKKGLTDKVSSVFQASLKLLRMILSEFVSSHQLGRSEIVYCVEQTLPSLFSRTGESSRTLCTLALDFIQEMSMYKEVRPLHLIPCELVKPIKSSLPVRLALSRLELLEKLLEQLSTKDSGFTLDNVMRFLAGALQHSAAAVREVSVRIVLAMYRLHGNSILSYLPSNDATTRKNVLYKNLFDSFAKIDGRLLDPQLIKKGGTQRDGEREKEEIRSLQEQLAFLRDISEKGKDKNKSPEKKVERTPKPGVKKGTHSVSTDPKRSQSAVANYLDNLCIFCGEKDKSFTEEGLDLHYWKHCPMLYRCLQCRQVVEIASLTEHLLSECEHKVSFDQCPRCSEAIIREELSEHAQSSDCNSCPVDASCNHCPLCHENFPPGEEAWKFHLMDSSVGCKQNTRRTLSLQRPLAHTQGKTVSTATSKPTAAASVSKEKGIEKVSSRIHGMTTRPSRTSHIKTGKALKHRPIQA